MEGLLIVVGWWLVISAMQVLELTGDLCYFAIGNCELGGIS